MNFLLGKKLALRYRCCSTWGQSEVAFSHSHLWMDAIKREDEFTAQYWQTVIYQILEGIPVPRNPNLKDSIYFQVNGQSAT